ncbi:MAG: winged helix-turn-helix domain-containing protein [Candidatus Bathyarchaeia archaeon]|jgi:DNA-binding HxlR family transcriptional regulator
MDNSSKTDQATSDLLNNLREEIKNLRVDVNRIEESVLKQRLLSIEETLSQNHLEVYANQRAETIDDNISLMLKSDCPTRGKCLPYFKGKIEDNTRAIKASSKKAIVDLDDKIAENDLMIEKNKGGNCENCFTEFSKRLKREKRAYQEITLIEDLSKQQNENNLDVAFIVDNFLEPLANYSRLTILSSVTQGKKSFSELSKITNIKAGHLAFHLRKLVAAKLVAQEATKGDYVVTQRGLELIKKLESLQPEITT